MKAEEEKNLLLQGLGARIKALRNAAGVTMSRGLMFASVMASRQSTISFGNCSRRRGSSDAGATMCSGSRPRTAMNVCIVL